MRLLTRIVAGGGVAAFFFFSWVIMTLWNSIVAGHLGLARSLSYLQTCGLWFMIILLLAWTGIAVRWPLRRAWRAEVRGEDLARDMERKIKRGLARWVGASEDIDWDELGERIEKRIKSRLKEWISEDED